VLQKINATGNPGCTLFNSECTISAGNTLGIVTAPVDRSRSFKLVCVQPRQLGCQHDTARICCLTPCCGARRCRSIYIFCPQGAQQQTGHTPQRLSNEFTHDKFLVLSVSFILFLLFRIAAVVNFSFFADFASCFPFCLYVFLYVVLYCMFS